MNAAKILRRQRNKRIVTILLSGLFIVAAAGAVFYFMGKSPDSNQSDAKAETETLPNTSLSDMTDIADSIVYDRTTPLSKGQVRAFRYHVDHLTAGEYLLSSAMLKDDTGIYGYSKYLNDRLKNGEITQETVDKAYSEAEAGLSDLTTDREYGYNYYDKRNAASNAYSVAVTDYYAVNFDEFLTDMTMTINNLDEYISAVNSYDDYLIGLFTDLTQKGIQSKFNQLSSDWPLPEYTIQNPNSDAYQNREYHCHALVDRNSQTGRLEINGTGANEIQGNPLSQAESNAAAFDLDIKAINDGDLSTLVGTWKNGHGDVLFINADGTTNDGRKVTGVKDSDLTSKILYADSGCILKLQCRLFS